MSDQSTSLVLTNGRVFDGHSFLDGPHDVHVAGGRVSSVVPSGSAGAEEGARTVDASGQVVLPGLIDCHVHMTAERAGSMEAVHEPFSLEFFRAVHNLRVTLATGITAARDAGGSDLGVKRAVELGMVAGPELAIAVQIIGQTGGHSDHRTASGATLPFFQETPGRPRSVADGADDFLKVTRELFRAGADHIKICSTGGVLSPTDDPRHSQMTPAEIEAVVGEAQRHGSYVMSHAQGAEGIKNALRAGVRTIEHGIYLDEEAIDLLLEREAYLVPTLQAPLEVIRGAESGVVSLPPAVVEKARRVVDTHQQSIATAVERGVRVAMGTDAGVGVHGTNLEELQLMQQVGMSLQDVLRAATSTAAEVLQRDDLGRLADGATAHLVMLREGDLDRIGELRAGDLRVWQRGVEVSGA
ncbi:amidohydrolase family protein [Kytococcus sedentarius]|uniref:metal-dependent hydrolase family protein n=1 Tax=Kytococcus sedentarius TaxID=1276 RepID=UPI00387A4710